MTSPVRGNRRTWTLPQRRSHEVEAFYVALGRVVRTRRMALVRVQADVAKALGVSRASVANIERGTQAVLAHQVEPLAESLGWSAGTLLRRVQEVIDV